jgi:hypothetical protein
MGMIIRLEKLSSRSDIAGVRGNCPTGSPAAYSTRDESFSPPSNLSGWPTEAANPASLFSDEREFAAFMLVGALVIVPSIFLSFCILVFYAFF